MSELIELSKEIDSIRAENAWLNPNIVDEQLRLDLNIARLCEIRDIAEAMVKPKPRLELIK